MIWFSWVVVSKIENDAVQINMFVFPNVPIKFSSATYDILCFTSFVKWSRPPVLLNRSLIFIKVNDCVESPGQRDQHTRFTFDRNRSTRTTARIAGRVSLHKASRLASDNATKVVILRGNRSSLTAPTLAEAKRYYQRCHGGGV